MSENVQISPGDGGGKPRGKILEGRFRPVHVNDEFEKALLGSIINGGKKLIDELGQSALDDIFHLPTNVTVYGALVSLYLDGEISLISVTERLRHSGELEKVGGAGVVTELAFKATSDPDIARYYFNQLVELRAKRQLAVLGTEMLNGSIEPEKVQDRLASIIDTSKGSLPAVEDVASWISREVALPPDIIAGLLNQGGKMSIGGASKTHKTWLFIALALAVASGSQYLGFDTSPGRVLFVNLELQAAFMQRRVKDVAQALGLKHESLQQLDVWNLRGSAAELGKLLPEFLRQTRRRKYALIIIDPLYKLLVDGDENSANFVAAAMNGLEKLAVESGAAVAFAAHFSKGNQAKKEAIDRVSGSGVYGRDPDSILNFTAHEEKGAFVAEFTLRNHPPIEPFVVRWDYPLMRRDDALDPSRLRQSGTSRFSIEGTPEIAARTVREHGGTMKRKECVDAIVAEYNLSSDSPAYACIKRARSEKLLGLLPGAGHVLHVIEQ